MLPSWIRSSSGTPHPAYSAWPDVTDELEVGQDHGPAGLVVDGASEHGAPRGSQDPPDRPVSVLLREAPRRVAGRVISTSCKATSESAGFLTSRSLQHAVRLTFPGEPGARGRRDRGGLSSASRSCRESRTSSAESSRSTAPSSFQVASRESPSRTRIDSALPGGELSYGTGERRPFTSEPFSVETVLVKVANAMTNPPSDRNGLRPPCRIRRDRTRRATARNSRLMPSLKGRSFRLASVERRNSGLKSLFS